MSETERADRLGRVRLALGSFILGLVLSGLTAFPIQYEIDSLAWLTPRAPPWLADWILFVRDGVTTTYAHYPFMAYGTDWLAFAHVAIALFFLAPLRDPVRNMATIETGLLLCLLVIPVALICGPLRGIPFYWRLLDCSFGVFGALPLSYARYHVQRLASTVSLSEPSG